LGKLAIGALVAAIVLFAWGYVSHEILPLGSMGVSGFPDEATATALLPAVPDSGLYIYPWMDPTQATEETFNVWSDKAKAGPVIFMAYDHDGRDPMSAMTFVIEFATNLVSCFLAALLLTQISGGFGARFMTVVILGLFVGITSAVPQWNWFGFSTDFTVAALLMHGAGWFLAGIPLAMLVKPDRGQPS